MATTTRAQNLPEGGGSGSKSETMKSIEIVADSDPKVLTERELTRKGRTIGSVKVEAKATEDATHKRHRCGGKGSRKRDSNGNAKQDSTTTSCRELEADRTSDWRDEERT